MPPPGALFVLTTVLYRFQGAISFARTYANSSAAETPNSFDSIRFKWWQRQVQGISLDCCVLHSLLFIWSCNTWRIRNQAETADGKKEEQNKKRVGKVGGWCVWKKVNKLQIPSRAFTFQVTSSKKKKQQEKRNNASIIFVRVCIVCYVYREPTWQQIWAAFYISHGRVSWPTKSWELIALTDKRASVLYIRGI